METKKELKRIKEDIEYFEHKRSNKKRNAIIYTVLFSLMVIGRAYGEYSSPTFSSDTPHNVSYLVAFVIIYGLVFLLMLSSWIGMSRATKKIIHVRKIKDDAEYKRDVKKEKIMKEREVLEKYIPI